MMDLGREHPVTMYCRRGSGTETSCIQISPELAEKCSTAIKAS